MNAEGWTPSERYDLALAATLACVDRLRNLLRWSDARDIALHEFLRSLLRNELRRLSDLGRAGIRPKGPRSERLDPDTLRRLLEESFPSFYKPLGEGPIDRERALYLAECLEEESARFYRELSGPATNPAAKNTFLRLKREDDSALQFVRDVVLGKGR